MTAATETPQPDRRPFADAAPAQIRDALIEEDAVEFDRQWRAAMDRAKEQLDLSGVTEMLESWRRVAWMTTVRGRHGYRETMASAAERLRTGERGPGAIPWQQLKAELGLPD